MRSAVLARGKLGSPASAALQPHLRMAPARRSSCRASAAVATAPATASARPAAITAKGAKLRLFSLLNFSVTGRGTTDANREEIMEAVAELQEAAAGSTTTGSFTSGTWELLWTTEKVRGGAGARARVYSTAPGGRSFQRAGMGWGWGREGAGKRAGGADRRLAGGARAPLGGEPRGKG